MLADEQRDSSFREEDLVDPAEDVVGRELSLEKVSLDVLDGTELVGEGRRDQLDANVAAGSFEDSPKRRPVSSAEIAK